MKLRRRQLRRRARQATRPDVSEFEALVARLERQRDQLDAALAATPDGVGFTVVGGDYLPTSDVARRLADTEVLLRTARHRLTHATLAS